MRKRELHAIRKRAAKAALAQRWGGDARAPSKQIRVDADAAEVLSKIPDRDRRAVASRAIREAVAEREREIVRKARAEARRIVDGMTTRSSDPHRRVSWKK